MVLMKNGQTGKEARIMTQSLPENNPTTLKL